MIYDISPLISSDTPVWPGDTPVGREVLCEISRGDSVTLSTLRATVHLGAHADGPNHYHLHGQHIAQRPLEPYLGPCHVVHARAALGDRVTHSALINPPTFSHPRVLIRTATYAHHKPFQQNFAALDPDLIHTLAHAGVRLIGIDTPSVDLFSSKDLPAHRAFFDHDMNILEGLMLDDVPPGDYELIALPLKLVDFDASPVRAVLRTLSR